MSTFTIILLLVILVLIASDVFFLWRIFKNMGKRKRSIPDERYFELKYNINLLKAVSAILIFLLGFLGFTTYRDITSIVESDFEERFNEQQERINQLDSIVSGYEELVKALKSTEGQSIENLNDIKREFGIINRKVAQAEDALKYVSKIYLVKDLVFTVSNKENTSINYNFKNLRTVYGDRLPKFRKSPFIIVQSKNGIDLIVDKIDQENVTLSISVVSQSYLYDIIEENPRIKFDLWIAEPN